MDEERAISPRADVVCLGETMALFVPDAAGEHWRRTAGGAESNVACHLARSGVRSRWVSAVGDDPFGRAVLDLVSASGADTSGVRVDPQRATGLYFKDPDPSRGRVHYYRRGSAASALGPDLLGELDLSGTALLHLTGITPALSPSCRALVEESLELPRGPEVSFDVNWRPAVWRGSDVDDPADLLRRLADRAGTVLVGDDEAAALWGCRTVTEVRAVLPGPRALVVKHGSRGATLVEDGAEVFQPALRVRVVDPVGAGDAFAAGYLAATLSGQDRRHRLRAGHLRAAAVLCTGDDMSAPLPAADVRRMLAADAPAWSSAVIEEGRLTG
ncbi:sugar kinase [Saccharopolyspora sp. HNM0983]|uniref:Sugar kinase n=1 Tax=Saccharopolyspora montiporae TaxID=2781240 RepID=A0A929BC19_9PSEU|nr:sugar kinase [Saccharopolyspora sp. HNM0983]MBE9375266.1 sugar kinase [Saccharopolyspora sp. HNM0983]